MKKLCLIAFLIFSTSYTKAQEARVEKSTFSIQTGWFGVWINNETRLTNTIALRSELGVSGEYYPNGYYKNTWFLVGPTLALEPRWYYNISKRHEKGKSIAGNSANFISLNTKYIPDWFYSTNNNELVFLKQLSIIPTWGIKRSLGKHFNYEAGIGAGYLVYIKDQINVPKTKGEFGLNLHLRIGYILK